jgi:hypothetical protein
VQMSRQHCCGTCTCMSIPIGPVGGGGGMTTVGGIYGTDGIEGIDGTSIRCAPADTATLITITSAHARTPNITSPRKINQLRRILKKALSHEPKQQAPLITLTLATNVTVIPEAKAIRSL